MNNPATKLRSFQEINKNWLLTITVFLCMLLWLLIHYPSLGYFWNWDDLHLVRKFSSTEIIKVFFSTWDVDGVETPGFRPFTVLFNHFRFILIGESTAGHRLFLISLMAMLLWMIGWIFLKFGLKRRVVVFSLLLLSSSKYLTGDIVWIADGIHVFQNILIAASLIWVILAIDKNKKSYLFFSLCFACLALLTREDSLVLWLLLPLFIALYHNKADVRFNTTHFLASFRKYFFYFLALYSMGIIIFIWRAHVAPGSPSVSSIPGLVWHIRNGLWVVGSFLAKTTPDKAHLANPGWAIQDGGYLFEYITLLWSVLLGAIAAAFMLTARRVAKWQVAICGIGFLLSCAPGISVSRPNLLFIPTVFLSLGLSIAVFELLKIGPRTKNMCCFSGRKYFPGMVMSLVFLTCITAIGGSMLRSYVLRLDMHPYSINQVLRDYEVIYGVSSQHNLIIPAERREVLVNKLNSLGMYSDKDDLYEFTCDLYENAKVIRLSSLFFVDRWTDVFIPIAVFTNP